MCVGRPPGDREETSLRSGDKEEEMFVGSGDRGKNGSGIWVQGVGSKDREGEMSLKSGDREWGTPWDQGTEKGKTYLESGDREKMRLRSGGREGEDTIGTDSI